MVVIGSSQRIEGNEPVVSDGPFTPAEPEPPAPAEPAGPAEPEPVAYAIPAQAGPAEPVAYAISGPAAPPVMAASAAPPLMSTSGSIASTERALVVGLGRSGQAVTHDQRPLRGRDRA